MTTIKTAQKLGVKHSILNVRLQSISFNIFAHFKCASSFSALAKLNISKLQRYFT